jgi:hypothetical protein
VERYVAMTPNTKEPKKNRVRVFFSKWSSFCAPWVIAVDEAGVNQWRTWGCCDSLSVAVSAAHKLARCLIFDGYAHFGEPINKQCPDGIGTPR